MYKEGEYLEDEEAEELEQEMREKFKDLIVKAKSYFN